MIIESQNLQTDSFGNYTSSPKLENENELYQQQLGYFKTLEMLKYIATALKPSAPPHLIAEVCFNLNQSATFSLFILFVMKRFFALCWSL
jgi:hypothetical protein